MDSSRTPQSPDRKRRRVHSPSSELSTTLGPHIQQQPQQQTSLPSIRQLHPYLPPSSSSIVPSLLSSTDPASYAYPPATGQHTHYTSPAHLGQLDAGAGAGHGISGAASALAVPQRETGLFGVVGESDADDVDQRGPPKKKRRRQALSCTECKRRKIKCDRTQPCTPCTRRGEESGCQWHIVEPVEKYATKAEFDDLKARFEQLAALVQRLLPAAAAAAATGGHTYYPMGGVMSGVSGEVLPSSYGASGTSGPLGYSSLMPAHQPQQQGYTQHLESPSHATSTTSTSRYIKPEGAQSPTRAAHQITGLTSSTMTPPGLTRHRVDASPTSAAAAAAVPSGTTLKSSPLSLSAITTPFNPATSGHLNQQHSDSQSKNYHAQMLKLGERLRPGSEDPVISFAKTLPLEPVERRHRHRANTRVRARSCISTALCRSSRPLQLVVRSHHRAITSRQAIYEDHPRVIAC